MDDGRHMYTFIYIPNMIQKEKNSLPTEVNKTSLPLNTINVVVKSMNKYKLGNKYSYKTKISFKYLL